MLTSSQSARLLLAPMEKAPDNVFKNETAWSIAAWRATVMHRYIVLAPPRSCRAFVASRNQYFVLAQGTGVADLDVVCKCFAHATAKDLCVSKYCLHLKETSPFSIITTKVSFARVVH